VQGELLVVVQPLASGVTRPQEMFDDAVGTHADGPMNVRHGDVDIKLA
jgi:hypothetical protein